MNFATRRQDPPIAVVPLFLLVMLIHGCSTSAPEQTRFMREQTQMDISAEELRIKVRALAIPFSGIIEETADSIAELDQGPESRIISLRLKTNAIPAVQNALFDPDPLVALLDTWALALQMDQMIEHHLAGFVPAETIDILSAGVGRMESEISTLVKSIAKPGGYEYARDLVQEWVGENPVEATLMSRRSVVTDLAHSTAIAQPGIREAIGGLTHGINDVWARLDVYSAYLPKQARWQAELMVLDVASGRDPGAVLDHLASVTRSIDRIADTVEDAPGLVSSEREVVLRALQAEREIALQAFSDELQAAYLFISQERVAAFTQGLAEERRAAIEALTKERIATLQAIHEERVATMEELETIVGGLSEDAMARLVDRIFVRVLLLLVIVGVVTALFGFFMFRRTSA